MVEIKRFDPKFNKMAAEETRKILDEVCKKITEMHIKSDKERLQKIHELLGFNPEPEFMMFSEEDFIHFEGIPGVEHKRNKLPWDEKEEEN